MLYGLRWIKQHLVLSIMIGMVVGLMIGQVFDTTVLSPSVTMLSFLMVYPMMVTLHFPSLLTKGNTRLQVVTQLINFIYLPFLAFVFGLIFFTDAIYLRLAILLIALLPTSGMTVSWTVMAKGNVKAAIRMIIIGLVLGGLLTPFYIGFYLGEAIDIPFIDIFRQIIYIVFLPMILGFFTQVVLKKQYGPTTFHTTIKPIFPLFSTLFVLVLITLVMSMRSRMLLSDPFMFIRILVPLVIGYALMIASVHLIGVRLFNFEDRVALVNGTMVRNLSLALAIALTVFSEVGPEVALVIGVAYIVQVQFAAWYVKYSIIKESQ